MADDPAPVKSATPTPSTIVISFPNGPHTTTCMAQYNGVDTVQIEIAGSFLSRFAKAQYEERTNPGIQGFKGLPPNLGRV